MTQGWFYRPNLDHRPHRRLPAFGDAASRRFRSTRAQLLAEVFLYDRTAELSSTLTMPRPNFPVVNFLDAGAAPLVLLTAELTGTNIERYSTVAYQLSILHRVEQGDGSGGHVPRQPIPGIGCPLPGNAEVCVPTSRRRAAAECCLIHSRVVNPFAR